MNHSSSSTSNSEVTAETKKELFDVRRLLKRMALFSVPFVVYVLLIFAVDPFNFLTSSSFVSDDVKRSTAFQLNPCVWKMAEFDKVPKDKILLGDSRMQSLKSEDVKAVANEDFYNFAYGGGTLREVIDTFYFASKRTELKKAIIGINLDTYNDYNITERTKLYPSFKENPTLYFVNKTVLQSAFTSAYSQITKTDMKIGKPNVDKETFWKHELNDVMGGYFQKYVYPVKYKKELEELAKYCKEKNIELAFVIFPTHVDTQNLVKSHHLEKENQQMRTDLSAIAKVYDFDYENEVTTKKENYDDPVHFTKPIQEQIIREILSGQTKIAKTK